jgi:hypothetical protein
MCGCTTVLWSVLAPCCGAGQPYAPNLHAPFARIPCCESLCSDMFSPTSYPDTHIFTPHFVVPIFIECCICDFTPSSLFHPFSRPYFRFNFQGDHVRSCPFVGSKNIAFREKVKNSH